jgi:hypothetical protein
MFVKPMKKGVTTTVLVDFCRSGSIFDLLLYRFGVNDKKMSRENRFDMKIINEAVRPLTKEELRVKRENEKQKQREEKAALKAENRRIAAVNQPSQNTIRAQAAQNLRATARPGVMVFEKMPSPAEIEKIRQYMIRNLQNEANKNA